MAMMRRAGNDLFRMGRMTTMTTTRKNVECNSSLTMVMRSLSVSTKNKENSNNEYITYLGLNNLSDNPGAIKKKRRIGRGIGSSKGKTSGRGHKGQKARAGGGVSPMFEGGQTPFYKRIPKRGFTNVHQQEMVPINVGTLQDYIDMGRLRVPTTNDDEPPLTMKDLVQAGMTKSNAIKHGIKLLSKGKERLVSPIKIDISRASQSAIQAIESVGGQITTVHYNRLALRALLKPHKFDILPKRARPPPKLMSYYTNYQNRGYLSPQIQLRNLQKQQQQKTQQQKQQNQPTQTQTPTNDQESTK